MFDIAGGPFRDIDTSLIVIEAHPIIVWQSCCVAEFRTTTSAARVLVAVIPCKSTRLATASDRAVRPGMHSHSIEAGSVRSFDDIYAMSTLDALAYYGYALTNFSRGGPIRP